MPGSMNHLLKWMLDYEIRSCQRYGHPVTLVMIATGDHRPVPKHVLAKTIRSSDAFFELDSDSALLMEETPKQGALAAVERFEFVDRGVHDLRFGIAEYPEDGTSGQAMLETAIRNLLRALAGEHGPVVTTH